MDACNKKILLFIPCFNLGGAEHQAFRFSLYLTQHNYNVVLGSFDNKGPVLELCKKNNVNYAVIPIVSNYFTKCVNLANRIIRSLFKKCLPDYWQTSYSLGKFINKNEFRTVMSYCAPCNIFLGYSRKIIKNSGKNFIWFQRDAGLVDDYNYYKSDAIKQFDCILANSISGQNFLKDFYNIDCDVVRNGVESQTSLLTKEDAKKLFNVNNKQVVTMVANLHHNKNHIQLLQAWKNVCNNIPNKDLVLMLAGNKGDSYEKLSKFILENNISNKVCFLGQVENIPDLLKATDIFAFASKSEGSPNSVIEACFAGLPIVATDLSVIRDCVCPENYCFLDNSNVQEMSEHLIYLINHLDKASEIGTKNQKRCENVFSFEENFKELELFL